jgi:hypothetical protein
VYTFHKPFFPDRLWQSDTLDSESWVSPSALPLHICHISKHTCSNMPWQIEGCGIDVVWFLKHGHKQEIVFPWLFLRTLAMESSYHAVRNLKPHEVAMLDVPAHSPGLPT